jgi:hypothetical protein
MLMFVDDFVELNFSDRNSLNLRPYPDTTLAFHGVCPEALTIRLKTAKNLVFAGQNLFARPVNWPTRIATTCAFPWAQELSRT